MMKLDTKHAFLKEDILSYQDKVNAHHEALMNKTGKGNDFVGWVAVSYTHLDVYKRQK